MVLEKSFSKSSLFLRSPCREEEVNLQYGKLESEGKQEESADLGEFEVLRKMRTHHLAYPVDSLHDGVVEIVDYRNSEASFEELHDGVGAYETGTTGDQNLLGG